MRTAMAASAGALLQIPTEGELAYAQRRRGREASANAVMIDSNENPLGPVKEACDAIAGLGIKAGRYEFELAPTLVKTFAKIEGLNPEYVRVYAGSTQPLHYTVLAFTSPEKSLVMADPSYEAPMFAASDSGARVSKIPLTKEYAHDVKAMATADSKTGLFYICNPNNPTGTITTREDIEYLLAHKPKESVVLVDEAYIHLSDARPVLDLAAADKDIVVLRTFSKLYGMAGLRCGLAVGRPDLLAKLDHYGYNFMPVPALLAAMCSLKDKALIPERKKINADIRNETFSWLAANNYSFVPSQSNCFMVDVKRPGQEFIAAMQKKNVYIGRVWPAWPTHVRVTVGTMAEMESFRRAFKEVMSAPAETAYLDRPTVSTWEERHPYYRLS